MKTEAEIREKLKWLNASLHNFNDNAQMLRMRTDIARLNWVLGEGPDVIIVPHPVKGNQ